jgi:hypothetical protein
MKELIAGFLLDLLPEPEDAETEVNTLLWWTCTELVYGCITQQIILFISKMCSLL